MVFRFYSPKEGWFVCEPTDPTLAPKMIELSPGFVVNAQTLGQLICITLEEYPFTFGDEVHLFNAKGDTKPAARLTITPTGLVSAKSGNRN